VTTYLIASKCQRSTQELTKSCANSIASKYTDDEDVNHNTNHAHYFTMQRAPEFSTLPWYFSLHPHKNKYTANGAHKNTSKTKKIRRIQ
jgi:hypothetical protein